MAIAFITAYTGIADAVRSQAPDLASVVDPFDVESRIDLLAQGLAAETIAPADLTRLVTDSRRLVALAPADSRVWSLAAEAERRAGNAEASASLYKVAGGQSMTELLSLSRLLAIDVESGNHAAAIDRLGILLRRWQERAVIAIPAIVDLLQVPGGYDASLDALANRPQWRRPFFAVMLIEPRTAPLLARMQLDLFDRGVATDADFLTRTMNALINAQAVDDAYRLFLLTRPGAGQVAYVYNGDFRNAPTGLPFDWQISQANGVDVEWRADGGIQLRFLDKPVRTAGIQQFLTLRPGTYTLRSTVAATGAAFPKRLYWRIGCRGNRTPFGIVPIPPGDYGPTEVSGIVDLPEDCPLYQLSIGTDLTVDSFQQRYTGTLDISSVTLTRNRS